ncbi:class I SAM-dependent methyltransferase [Agromyces sp. ISL-38]|uniref:class I SAM-dependent methyltransferase n=1 Tax=Agromyces sp. ISL-38 TaxID=2819107 RepID=UPI001BECD1FB|nr:class I SAM-dependent methyltransferase [Agromyces sp. ISL-38]MBT2497942.1 class I SAM-dependent methyltransferase [Agromyces sp. ISL-38]MBT2516983.1 class I SAM-dependent methyltransferase [Streptomyces sp. ISL-90]
MSDDSNEEGQGDAVSDFVGRVFASALGALEILSIYLGVRLGWYRALAEAGQLSSTELARRTATQERYAREWLEQQAVSGILTVEETDAADAAPVAASDRRFSLPAAHAEVLTDGTSLDYFAPFVRMFAASAVQLPQLLDAYRAGGGVSWQQLGADAHESQGDQNRPWFEKRLAPALASVDSLHQVLSRPGAHIADVGCGHGWSTLALARAYPDARVEGFDVDQPSIEAARRHATEAGLGDHVRFHLVGGEELAAEGRFDAAFVFEAVHDMPYPVEVLAAIRRAVRDDGEVVIMDEAVAERFAPDGDEIERLMYGFSLFVCLPDSLSSPGSVGTGTVMRQSTLEGYALEAGFSGIEELPIEGFAFFRFTRLVR